MNENTTFDPIRTWVRFGVSDLYFGYINQSNDVFQYGTFFYIMGAEKHLKAILIENYKAEYSNATNLTDKRIAVEKIAKRYSHKFKKMVDEVSVIYHRETGKDFVRPTVYGYDLNTLIQSMFEGYMETRYPVVAPTAHRYPFPNVNGSYHDPIGSSFFTKFISKLCQTCWEYLVCKGIDPIAILSSIEEQYAKSRGYSEFKKEYIEKLSLTTQ